MTKLIFLFALLSTSAFASKIGIVCDDQVSEKYLLHLDVANHTGKVYKYHEDDNTYHELDGKVIVNPNTNRALFTVIHTPPGDVIWEEGECFRFVSPVMSFEVRGDESSIWKRSQVVINPEMKNCSYPRVEPGPRRTLKCTNP